MVDTHPAQTLQKLAEEANIDITSKQFAQHLDVIDDLKKYRDAFHYPKTKTLPKVDQSLVNPEEECIYLCGHSLGLCPKETEEIIKVEIQKWQEMGVEGHTHGKYPYAYVEDYINEKMAKIVGGKPIEVFIMNGLSVNINLMMVTFYQPTPKRHKILIEGGAFPSDHIAVESQLRYHGYDPKDSLILAKPRPGEESLRPQDIIDLIEKEGDEIALILFTGVQYYTGQYFDLKKITEVGHKKGCTVGFDLAHAVGNVELSLHDWNVDFACWCTYKYLNSGPGATGGIFLHEKYAHENNNIKRFSGWWGVDITKRFTMDNSDLPFVPGAAGFAMSNPPLFSTMGLFASLELFEEVGMEKIVKKQRLLTGYLEFLIVTRLNCAQDKELVTILTPSDVTSRGSQLSLSFAFPVEQVHEKMTKRGIVCDIRKPKVIRIAPIPLYNSFYDVYRFVEILKQLLNDSA